MNHNPCRFDGCANQAPEGQSRCELHRLRWLPGKPVEPEPMSPWVRRIREGHGFAKVIA